MRVEVERGWKVEMWAYGTERELEILRSNGLVGWLEDIEDTHKARVTLHKVFSNHKQLYDKAGFDYESEHSPRGRNFDNYGFHKFSEDATDAELESAAQAIADEFQTFVDTSLHAERVTAESGTQEEEPTEIDNNYVLNNNTIKLRVGSEIYALTPRKMEEETSLVEDAKEEFEAQVKADIGSADDKIRNVVSSWKNKLEEKEKEVEELKRDLVPAPEINMDELGEIQIVREGEYLLWILPFETTIEFVKYQDVTKELPDELKKSLSGYTALATVGSSFRNVRILDENKEPLANPHQMSEVNGRICTGNLDMDREINTAQEARDIRDDVEQMMNTFNIDSPGTTNEDWMHEMSHWGRNNISRTSTNEVWRSE